MSGMVWSETLGGRKIHCALGERDVFIIAPGDKVPPCSGPHSDEAVPRRQIRLRDEDRDKLTNQGIAKECHEDDLSIMKARFTNDRECNVTEEISYCNSAPVKLRKENVLRRIEIFLKTTLKPRGLSVYCIYHSTLIINIAFHITYKVVSTMR